MKLRPELSAKWMHFRGAPDGLKMACGENPKRVYGKYRGSAPRTRMGNLAMQRKAFLEAKKLEEEWTKYRASEAKRIAEDRRAQSNYTNEIESRRVQQAKCKADPYMAACHDWQKNWDKPLSPPMPSVAGTPPAMRQAPPAERLVRSCLSSGSMRVQPPAARFCMILMTLSSSVAFVKGFTM